MQPRPLRTTVIGSYPYPAWLEFACQHLDRFGSDDIQELQDDAVRVAIHDQCTAGLDVITDGEQTRLDFNLSFYGFFQGIEPVPASRRFGPPGHDQRDRYRIVGRLEAPQGLGTIEEFQRLRRLAPSGVDLKASVPGPYTLSGRLLPNAEYYPHRRAIAEALVPIVQAELRSLVEAGCREVAIDEPSMSCYAHREDRPWLVELFNRTVDGIYGQCRLTTHLCFGNYKGRPVAPRRYAYLLPEFLELRVDEIHLEMANREFAELEIVREFAQRFDVAVGIVDVKNYYIETPEEIAERTRRCLAYIPAERLALAPDCGLSQMARWAARRKLQNLVAGVRKVRAELGIE